MVAARAPGRGRGAARRATDARGAAVIVSAVAADPGDALQLAVAARQRAPVLTQLAHDHGLEPVEVALELRRVGARPDDAMAVLLRVSDDRDQALVVFAQAWSGHSPDSPDVALGTSKHRRPANDT